MLQLSDWYEEGRLRPHVGGVDGAGAGVEAIQLLVDRKAIGKVVLLLGCGANEPSSRRRSDAPRR